MQNTPEKVKNQREKSKFWGKFENSGGKVKIPRYFAFFPGKSKKPPLFPQKSQNSGGKLKIPGYFAFSLGKSEKTKGKVKIPREKQNTSEKALFPPKIPTR